LVVSLTKHYDGVGEVLAFMHDLIMRLQFVKYPEAAPKPPVGAEIEALRASRRAKKE
jgi:hypothetical protein